jgi:hypothetical protein
LNQGNGGHGIQLTCLALFIGNLWALQTILYKPRKSELVRIIVNGLSVQYVCIAEFQVLIGSPLVDMLEIQNEPRTHQKRGFETEEM